MTNRVAAIAAVITFVALAVVHPAYATVSTTATIGGGCANPAVSFTGAVFGVAYTFEENGALVATRTDLVGNIVVPRGNPYTSNVTLVVKDAGSTIASATFNCGSNNAVTFCNLSGDGRVNGLCGDRIVVYCNAHATPPNVDVWVIDNGGSGHELTKLPLSDLTSVAEGKFAKNLGAGGVLFAGSDASGNGYAALQGGPYGGTAKGDWLKTFSCKAAS